MKKIDRLVEKRLEELDLGRPVGEFTPEDEIASYLGRKISTFEGGPRLSVSGLSREAQNFMNSLPTYTFSQIYGTSNLDEISPGVTYFEGGSLKDQWFILEQGFGVDKYIVNTEGSDYARYVAKLVG